MHLRSPLLVALFTLLAACDGRGCTAGGCGFEPLEAPLPVGERIENAVQMRLTQAGLQFIADNADVLPEEVPVGSRMVPQPPAGARTNEPVIGDVDIDLCPNGDCVYGIVPGAASLTAAPPDSVRVARALTVQSHDSSGASASFPVRLRGGCTFLGCSINTTCLVNIDASVGVVPDVEVYADVALGEESEAARAGYTYFAFDGRAGVTAGRGLLDEDVVVTGCDGVSGSLIDSVRALVRAEFGTHVPAAYESLVRAATESETCTLAGTAGCPAGSTASGPGPDARCEYAGGRCVPDLLGSDGRANLGALSVGQLSPAGDAPLRYVLAAGGDGEAVADGLSVFMHGVLASLTADFQTTPGHNACVPMVDPPALPVVARAASFRADAIPGSTDAAHLGYGIAEAYLDHAGYGLFDSGLLCVSPSSPLGAALQTGLVSVLASARTPLEYPQTRRPLSIGLRPQQPLEFTVGTGANDATLTLVLPALEMDIYATGGASNDRLLTFRSDLTMALDLVPDAGAVGVVLSSITASAPTVSNSDLLNETPEALATVLAAAMEAIVEQSLGALPPVSVTAVAGYDVHVTHVTPVTDNDVRFLAVYGQLAVPPASPPVVPDVDTTLTLEAPVLDTTSMQLATFGQGARNTVQMTMAGAGSDGPAYEFAYRVDGGFWSAWSTETSVTLNASALWLQARHVVEAKARLVGVPGSEDSTPAQVDLLIDISAPEVELSEDSALLTAVAYDIVSASGDLQYRFSVDDVWSDWGSASTAPAATSDRFDRVVEVMDEAGNVGRAVIARTVTQDAGVDPDQGVGGLDAGQDVGVDPDQGVGGPDAGRDAGVGPDSSLSGGGCGCVVRPSDSAGAWWGSLCLLLACVARRRSSRRGPSA